MRQSSLADPLFAGDQPPELISEETENEDEKLLNADTRHVYVDA